MSLPRRTIVSFTNTAENMASALSAIDRRREMRLRCRFGFVVRFIAKPEFRARWGVITDVAARGLGMLVRQPLEPGSVIALELSVRYSRPPTIHRATIHQAQPVVGDRWFVACELCQPLDVEDVRQLCQDGWSLEMEAEPSAHASNTADKPDPPARRERENLALAGASG